MIAPYFDLSIIIPARQEKLRLPKTLRLLEGFLKKFPYSTEIIIVIQGEDETAALVCEAAKSNSKIRLLHDPKGEGKGLAVRQGIVAARGAIVLFMDADLSVPLSCVEVLFKKIYESPHLDILIGSRHLPESQILIRQPLLRRLLGRAFNGLLRVMGLTHFNDTQCGCKFFRREAAKKIIPHATIDGFAFDVELLLLAEQAGLKIEEAPVIWADAGNSRFGIHRDGMKSLQDIGFLFLKKMTY